MVGVADIITPNSSFPKISSFHLLKLRNLFLKYKVVVLHNCNAILVHENLTVILQFSVVASATIPSKGLFFPKL